MHVPWTSLCSGGRGIRRLVWNPSMVLRFVTVPRKAPSSGQPWITVTLSLTFRKQRWFALDCHFLACSGLAAWFEAELQHILNMCFSFQASWRHGDHLKTISLCKLWRTVCLKLKMALNVHRPPVLLDRASLGHLVYELSLSQSSPMLWSSWTTHPLHIQSHTYQTLQLNWSF